MWCHSPTGNVAIPDDRVVQAGRHVLEVGRDRTGLGDAQPVVHVVVAAVVLAAALREDRVGLRQRSRSPRPCVPVPIRSPPAARLTHASRVNVEALRPGAAPNVT